MGDYSWVGPVLGIGAQMLAGAKGEEEAGKLTDQQKAILQDVYNKIRAGNFPQLKANELPQSEAGNVSTDPALRQAQMNALAKMQDIENNGGLTLQDLAAQKKTQDMANRSASANYQRVLEGMARRGMGGSGAELVTNLQGAQDASERANEAGMQSQANAQKRYYDSIMGRAKMAGDLRGEDFDQAMKTAQARDLRNKYNNDQAWDAQKYNAHLPVELLGDEMHAGGALGNFYGGQAQNARTYWAGNGVAAREALTPRKQGSTSSSYDDGGSYSAPPLLNADPEDDWNQWGGS